MEKAISESLIKVLREFGPIGLITYVGGFILLATFFFSTDFNRQILFGAVGTLLLILSVVIAFVRIKKESDREKALIDMVQNSGNRLAEQLKGMPHEQTVSITQTIWQNQKDLIEAMLGVNIDKLEKK